MKSAISVACLPAGNSALCFGASRYTRFCCSEIQSCPRCRISCSTLTKTSGPVRPVFASTDFTVDIFSATSPMISGCSIRISPAAHMRRGKGTGGRNPPFLGWPSSPVPVCVGVGKKYSQCQGQGRVPPLFSTTLWSKALASACTGKLGRVSVNTDCLPIQL